MDDNVPSTSKMGGDESTVRKNSPLDIDKKISTTGSGTSVSDSHSEHTQVSAASSLPMKAARTTGRKTRPKARQKRRRPIGRVHKRTRRGPKNLVRRRSKRLIEKEQELRRNLSASTVCTKLSSVSAPAKACPHCGHRCCRRSYPYHEIRRGKKKIFKKYRKRRLGKCIATQTANKREQGTGCIQVGSRCMMLSPLFLKTNATPAELRKRAPDMLQSYCEITPEMIVQSIRRLSMIRQAVATNSILVDIQSNYPVGRGECLLDELTVKLRVAVAAGIVSQPFEGSWELTNALMRLRKPTKYHVTLFWKLYADTMKPIDLNP